MNWFTKADFWSLFYEWRFPAESFVQATEQAQDIVNLSGITTGAVLDLCCGSGRHSVPLRKLGFDVTVVSIFNPSFSERQETMHPKRMYALSLSNRIC